ncbi:MAG: LysE family translocator [Rikenellaceae bacterium]|nr:LysE family translocator [Rikenellaceae bacterium]
MKIVEFITASVILTIMPGPDIIYVMIQGLTRGRKAGIAVSLGLCCGLFFHTMAAALGLSLIIANSPFLFNIVRYAGVAYLLYMGIKSFVSSGKSNNTAASENDTAQEGFLTLYKRGITMNVLNPKVLIFFLAFLPQFIDQSGTSTTTDIFILGGLFALQALIIFTTVSLLSGYLSNMSGKFMSGRAVGIVNGIVYWGIAVIFLFSRGPAA